QVIRICIGKTLSPHYTLGRHGTRSNLRLSLTKLFSIIERPEAVFRNDSAYIEAMVFVNIKTKDRTIMYRLAHLSYPIIEVAFMNDMPRPRSTVLPNIRFLPFRDET